MSIEYTPPPTLASFMRSDKRIRFVRGPVGPVSCDTEFLTPTGWVRMDAYEPGMEVAQWHPDGRFEFVEPLNYIVKPAPGQDAMIRFSNKHSLSMVVSPDHRMPLYDYNGKFVVKHADEVEAHPSKHTVPIHFYPTCGGLDMDEPALRLAVAIHADGHFTKRRDGGVYSRCCITLRKPRKKQRLEQLFAMAGVEYTVYANPNRPGEVAYRFNSPYVGKRFTGIWWRTSAEQLAIIMDEVTHWDGLFEGAESRYYSAHKEDADFIQYAAHVCGRRATVTCVEYDNPEWSNGYIVYITAGANGKGRVQIRRDSTEIERVPAPDGKKYCFSLPSTFFIARHNGCIFITGNSGKSTVMAAELFRRAAQQAPGPDGIRRTRAVIVRNTLQQLKTTCLETVKILFRDIMHYKVSDSTIQIRIGDIETDWILLPLDTEENIQRLLSLELSFAWGSEARELNPEVMMSVYSRCGRYPSQMDGGCTWHGLIMESNSFNEDSPWYKLLEEELNPAWGYWVQPGGLEPNAENVENLVPDYYKEQAENNTKEWAEQYIHNKITPSLSGQAVFRNSFNYDFHVAKEELKPVQGYPLIIGMDFARHPAAVIGQVDHTGRLLILAEVEQENCGVERFVRDHLTPVVMSDRFYGLTSYIVGDPSGVSRSQIGEESVFDCLKRLGFVAIPAMTNSIEPRIRAVEKFLLQQRSGHAGFLIDPKNCPKLVLTLQARYKYRKKTDGELEDKPEKKRPWSDLADALQYLCLGTDANMMGVALSRPGSQVKPTPTPAVGGWT